jgi:hypothetical protein
VTAANDLRFFRGLALALPVSLLMWLLAALLWVATVHAQATLGGLLGC